MNITCINCRYVGSIVSKKGLVCSQTKNFKSVNSNDTCDDYTHDSCERCGSNDIGFIKFSPRDKPYVIRTEYECKSCGSFWYLDL